jgi:hypothetical protein
MRSPSGLADRTYTLPLLGASAALTLCLASCTSTARPPDRTPNGQLFGVARPAPDHPSAAQVAASVNLHGFDLPGFSFVDDGTLDNTSRGGAFSGAGPNGSITQRNRRLIASAISRLATCERITTTLAYQWMGITQQTDLLARVHTGDFVSPDDRVSISSETGVALSDSDARADSAPYFRPQMLSCLSDYLRSIAPAQTSAYRAFGYPVTVKLTSLASLPVPVPPPGELATGYVMDFSQTPVASPSSTDNRTAPSTPGSLGSNLTIFVGYLTEGRLESIVFTYSKDGAFPEPSETKVLSAVESRVAIYAGYSFHSKQAVERITTEPPDAPLLPPPPKGNR